MTIRRSVLVVGGSGGIGAAAARALASSFDHVCLTYCSNEDAANNVASEIRVAGVTAACVPLDLGMPASCSAAVGAAAGGFELAGVVFAAAPRFRMDYTSRIPPEELVEMLTIEAGGFSRICHAAIPHLRRTAGGIVAVTSAALNRHVPKDTLSTAPKAAIEAMVRALAREEGRFGVRANSVRVGVVDGGMFHHFAGSDGAIDEAWVSAATENVALRRLGTPDEVGAVIAFLLSAGATYVSGQAIAVDGGFAI